MDIFMDKGVSIAIYLLGLATFVTFLSAQLISPIIPIVAKNLGAKDLNIATVSGSYIIFLALFQIFTGAFADRYGRRKVIALGTVMAAFSSILVVLAYSWEHLFILRVLGGVADAFVGPALLALVAELSGKEKGKAFGIFRSSQGLAFVVGPMMGGAIAHFFNIYAPFYFDFALTLLGVLLFLVFIRETEVDREKSPFSHLKILGHLKKDITLMKVACLGFSETFGFASLFSFLPALAIGFSMSEVEIASFFSAEAILFTLANLVVGVVSDKIGRKPMLTMGLAVSSATFIAFFLARDFWLILLLMAAYGFGSASVYVVSSAMAADVIPVENSATLFGAFDALMDIGLIVGPLIVFTLLSITKWPMNYSFLLMSIPSIMAIVLIPYLKETRKK